MNPEKKIYLAFYKKRKLYFNELKEATKLSNSSLQNILKKLEKKGLIKKEKTKSNTFYSLTNLSMTSIRFCEIDIEKLNKLNTSIKIPLKEFISLLPKEIHSALLFVSNSRKQETKKSEINIMIIAHSFKNKKLQETYFETILPEIEEAKKEAELISNHPLSYFVATYEEFKNHRNINISRMHRKTEFLLHKKSTIDFSVPKDEFFEHKKDRLINQAKITGFPIKNQQKYYEEILNDNTYLL